MEEENSDLITEFFGHGFFQHKSTVVGAIKNVMFRRILLVLVCSKPASGFRSDSHIFGACFFSTDQVQRPTVREE